MIILHAGERDGVLVLWGEAPREDGVTPPLPREQGSKPTCACPYPFGTSAEELAQALKRTALHIKPAASRMCQVTAWLPTRGASPVPSSPMIADPPKSRAKVKLAPWGVSGYAPSATEAVALLAASLGRRTLAEGIVVGADLAYWSQVLRLAASMTARQQFIPNLTAADNGHRASWSPVFAGTNAERLVNLARRMPGVARSLSDEADAVPPERPAITVLRQIVAMLLDYLVRTALTDQPATTARHRRNKPVFDSVHDSWLHALKSKDGAVYGEAGDLLELVGQVRDWRRPIAVSANSPYRLCFRLEEPEDTGAATGEDAGNSGDQWYVRYLLQTHEDPSLLIPLEGAWQSKGSQLSALGRIDANVREFLLTSLGQASGICPPVADSLEQGKLAGYGLDAAQAYEFLTEYSAALEQAGYGVMLPAWWTRKGTKARLTVQANAKSPTMQGGSGLSLETIVKFDWEVALGDQRIALDELEALAQLKAPLVRFRGQWVELNASEIQAAIDFWKERGTDEATFHDVVRMALGAGENRQGPDFNGVKADGWIGELLEQLQGQSEFEELPTPEDFFGTLRPYQVRGYSWLSFLRRLGLGACLADDMGLGKTVQTLALIQHDWQANGGRPVLLICPTSVINNWKKEAARFTPGLPLAARLRIT